jgi:pimeloyl-ACP methyl ester carboxylesterase
LEKFRKEEVRIGVGLILEHYIPAEKKHRYPLLFIHGMHEGGWVFENWLHVAADMGWDAWALNLRGHLNSRPVENFGRVSIWDYVEDVEDVLREIGPAILIGHSMGGLIVQLVADGDRNPDIPAVVLMNSAPGRGIFPGNRHTLLRYWKPQYLIASLLKRPLRPQRADMMYLLFNGMPPEEGKSAFRRMVPESGHAARELTFWCWLGQETIIDCPVFVGGATKDRLTPFQKKIARKYDAQYQEFPGAHALPIEQGWRDPIQSFLKWAADHNL